MQMEIGSDSFWGIGNEEKEMVFVREQIGGKIRPPSATLCKEKGDKC